VGHGRRAVGAVRRYTRHNGLSYLWTLTYREAAEDRRQVIGDLRRFYKRAAEKRWSPCAAVIERGDEGTKRLHVHWATWRYIDRHDVQWYWNLGNVDVGDRGEYTGRVAARELAGYLSKYVAKELDEVPEDTPPERAQGEHRYLVAQGFTPQPWRREFPTAAGADEWLRRVYGQWDIERPFGQEPTDEVWGVWRSYPDEVLDAWRAMT
jgi:hypothetical protein